MEVFAPLGLVGNCATKLAIAKWNPLASDACKLSLRVKCTSLVVANSLSARDHQRRVDIFAEAKVELFKSGTTATTTTTATSTSTSTATDTAMPMEIENG